MYLLSASCLCEGSRVLQLISFILYNLFSLKIFYEFIVAVVDTELFMANGMYG
jgi:hypothetical protein